jgi:hypothetical protein
MRGGSGRAHVRLEPHRLWTLRLSLGATRWLLYAVALVGVAATVRDTVAPRAQRTIIERTRSASDAGAQWFALSFARAYLTWSPDPAVHQQALAPFLSPSQDQDAGLAPAAGDSEQVAGLAIAAERNGPGGQRAYTVAADTGGGRTRYLVLTVAPAADGSYVLARYPALVAAPAPAAAGGLDGPSLPTVTNGAVIAVLDRALRNYVDGSQQNLAADLAPGALVDPVAPGLSVRAIERVAVEPSGSVLATVVAGDGAGDAFTLAYEVSLAQAGGRWEITRIGP